MRRREREAQDSSKFRNNNDARHGTYINDSQDYSLRCGVTMEDAHDG